MYGNPLVIFCSNLKWNFVKRNHRCRRLCLNKFLRNYQMKYETQSKIVKSKAYCNEMLKLMCPLKNKLILPAVVREKNK